MVKNLIIAGAPGTGKSTLIQQVIDEARRNHITVGGITTPEHRGPHGRLGFFLVDLQTKQRYILASRDPHGTPRIGRYRVHLDVVETHAVNAIHTAIRTCQLLCIDEIGKMELLAPQFAASVHDALDAPIRVLATMGRHIRHPLIAHLHTRSDTQILTLTKANRHTMRETIQALPFP